MAEAPPLAGGKAGCVISVSHSRVASEASGSPPEGPWSASGVVVSQSPGVVLCHGSVFSRFLLASELRDWSKCGVLLADSFSTDLEIQVLRPSECSSKTRLSRLEGDWRANVPALRFNPLSCGLEAQSGLECHKAELLMMVPCQPFQAAFSRVFGASEQWHFENEVGEECSPLADELCLLHWFALLRIQDCDFHGAGSVSCMPATFLRKGDPLFACGSPFGSFCPDIFMNTLSKGIVSNVAGEGNALILTDARCLPGTEGGGIFAVSGVGPQLVGIIVAPLCWKSNEWVGLTLVCAVEPILDSIKRVLLEHHWLLKTWLHPLQLVAKSQKITVAKDGPLQKMLAAVVLVECGLNWGSGVMVSPRVVLTCRHVVSSTPSVCVRLQPNPEQILVAKGKVVFATQDSSPYDVALVELDESLSTFVEPVLASTFYKGIVASNTRDNSIGATYPHLNFSIPITVLQPALLQYSRSRDLCGFQELDRVADRVQVVWRLQRGPGEAPLSKL
ncbi:peroxisomal leader peptide-processing protease isoform X2 [Eublepharis macularius]|uniref:Peroxisomal leader peptide-processing protease n=1 Tax=Eublepharis macularius TaxID=481883 RepID=A0AA97L1B6_EUBMA|nr:peroxisomal leader peptide-processing protease isoform X2 [Eublepharis macularius]